MIVHNLILVPASPAVHLSDIRFLGGTPIVAQRVTPAQVAKITGGAIPGAAIPDAAQPAGPTIFNSATNSGIIRGNQFNDGGFRDIGLQWRNVKVAGSVFVVHNTLNVNLTSGTSGPITISNVTFNSGAIQAARPADRRIISPPSFKSFIHVHPVEGKPLPKNPNVIDNSTNSGILLGGQFDLGLDTVGQIKLQWRGAAIRGSVSVVDNLLVVTAPPVISAPVTIQHVTFA